MMVLPGVGAFLISWFYRRLRDYHPEQWAELGSPTLIFNMSMAIQRRVSRFLWRGAYRRLNDPTLDRIAVAAKVLGAVTFLLFLTGFALTLTVL